MYRLPFLFFLSLVTSKKVFIDNDGLSALQVLFPLKAGWEVVGISASFGSSSAVDAVGVGSDILQTYNLTSCIPHYLGAQQPLLRNQETFDYWQDMFGSLVWQGAFAHGYEVSYSWSNITYDDSVAGAVAMVEAVKTNRDTDPVYIWAAGMMTTVAQALSLYPGLVNDSAGLYIMGGYFDTQYAAALGTPIVNDINTDINLIQDPEAAQIVLTADWKTLVIGANVTNYLVPSQELYDRLIARAGSLDVIEDDPYFALVLSLLGSGNYSENSSEETLPFWDEVVSAFMVWPDLIESTSEFSVAVDTLFYSPFYGNLRIWGHDYAPKGIKTGNATIVNKIDNARFYDLLIDTYFEDWRQYCATGKSQVLEY
ncbi:hypothetical protein Cantr_09423 [Candida viswanathii]|uniref:Inosine/uridine-preferring nucleoside hydrolase domain-containing protein n=1 Tax=Candida viswanathii TaxID=5486 RepID=A0A367Y9I4_9ASCO|nr:hypothetical protein Cantr_09423 [Candida viswanathii]